MKGFCVSRHFLLSRAFLTQRHPPFCHGPPHPFIRASNVRRRTTASGHFERAHGACPTLRKRWVSDIPEFSRPLRCSTRHERWASRTINCSRTRLQIVPSLRRQLSLRTARAMTSVLVMKPGVSVAGQVRDSQGKPVPGARIVVGYSTDSADFFETKTDATGRFVFPHVNEKPRFGRWTVNAGATGFAPTWKITSPDSKPLEFSLTPGKPFHGRVVDRQGLPVAGVKVILLIQTSTNATSTAFKMRSNLMVSITSGDPHSAKLCASWAIRSGT